MTVVRSLRRLLIALLAASLATSAASSASSAVAAAASGGELLVIVGAGGEPKYAAEFERWAEQWESGARRGGLACQRPSPDAASLQWLEERLTLLASEEATAAPLWIVFIGHGTYDGREAKFNLTGPDLSAAQLAAWLDKIPRPQAVAFCASSSAPFLNKLSRPGRVVITATRSGYERNYSRFGQHLAAAIADPAADLDKDEQTSLLEAFLRASHATAEYYRNENQLASEHPLLDDNGDGRGVAVDFFRGIRAVKAPQEGQVDGSVAHGLHLLPNPRELRAGPEFLRQRAELEQQIEALRRRKGEWTEARYYEQLEPLMIRLARLYESLDKPDR